jgi:SAM-dependent methyltransferase
MEFMDTFLPELITQLGISTAHDIGCGVGYFSEYLLKHNLRVIGSDVRSENVQIAHHRVPSVPFTVIDVENMPEASCGMSDMVLCTGLLYHVENPFLAIRNIASITKKLLVIESMIFPLDFNGAVLINEGLSQDQGATYVALIPSEQCFVNMLYLSKFNYVYGLTTCPNHSDFIETEDKMKIRTFFVVAKEELHHPLLKLKTKEFIDHSIFHMYRMKK